MEIPLLFSKNHKLETIFEKIIVAVWFWNFFRRPPTCPKFNTHKKVVVHFFIPMLLLPKTPPLTYPNIKEFKGPKKHHFTLFTHLTFLSRHFQITLFHWPIKDRPRSGKKGPKVQKATNLPQRRGRPKPTQSLTSKWKVQRSTRRTFGRE